MAKDRKLYEENYVTRWHLCSVVMCDCVLRIRIWPRRRDERSGIMIGAGGAWRSDRLLAFARVEIDSTRARTSGRSNWTATFRLALE